MKYERPIILTNGCFVEVTDWHKKYLGEASKYGHVVVLMNSNKSVQELKGYNNLPDENIRRENLLKLPYVTDVIIFDGNPDSLFEKIKPDYYCKGGDYTIDTIVQHERRTLEELKIPILFMKNYDRPQGYYWDKGYFDVEKMRSAIR